MNPGKTSRDIRAYPNYSPCLYIILVFCCYNQRSPAAVPLAQSQLEECEPAKPLGYTAPWCSSCCLGTSSHALHPSGSMALRRATGKGWRASSRASSELTRVRTIKSSKGPRQQPAQESARDFLFSFLKSNSITTVTKLQNY